ncbi:MAG: hypothetical protein HY673_09085 [Chloroflexi bacterium]|nr:hypothetical protein [Chloroflexota bacterium]
MKDDRFSEKLAWFKQNERPETVLLVADNPDMVKIIVAWTSLEVRPVEKFTELTGESQSHVWEWLWTNTSYSKTELVDLIGISFSEAGLESKMKLLVGNRILYPDGTVNSFVGRYLREQVLKHFETKPKRHAAKG